MEEYPQGQTLIDQKIQYQEGTLAVRFEDGTYIPFRLLTYGEYRALKSLLATETFGEEKILQEVYTRCVLDSYYKEKPKELRAGIPSTVSKLIIQISAPGDHEELVSSFEVYRGRLQDIEEQMKMIICATFPGYTMDKLDSCTFDMLVRLFAGAEWLMTWKGGEPFDFTKKGDTQSGRISGRDIAEQSAALRE